MKKLALYLSTLFALLFSITVLAGQPLGNLDPGIARPDSYAYGKSLTDWTEAHLRWMEAGEDPDARVNNVAFLPTLSGGDYTVEVETGTPLVLPVALWVISWRRPLA